MSWLPNLTLSTLLAIITQLLQLLQPSCPQQFPYTYPAYTFKLEIDEDSSAIDFAATWDDDRCDVDFVMYSQGQDIMHMRHNSMEMDARNRAQQIKIFDLDEGVYYFRGYLGVVCPGLTYKVQVKVDGDLRIDQYFDMHYDAKHRNKFIQYFPLNPEQDLENRHSTSAYDITVKGALITGVLITCRTQPSELLLFSISEGNKVRRTLRKQSCQDWDLIIFHQQSARVQQLSPYSITFTEIFEQWRIYLIIGVLLSFVIIIIALACIYRKYFYRNIAVNAEEDRSEANLQILKKISLVEEKEVMHQECSICLDSGCNAKLECGHFFHQKCLKEWVLNKAECPLCRHSLVRKEQAPSESNIIA